jgi:hypothetical protein
MAPRLNKRQIRELEELEELERNRLAAAAEEETIDEEPAPLSAFSAVSYAASSGPMQFSTDKSSMIQLNEEDEVEEEVEDLTEVEVKVPLCLALLLNRLTVC